VNPLLQSPLLPNHDWPAAEGTWLADGCATDVHRDIGVTGAHQVERLTARAGESSRPDRIDSERPHCAPVMYRDLFAGRGVACHGRLVAGGGVLAAIVDALVDGRVRSAAGPRGRGHVAQTGDVVGTNELALVVDAERRTLEVRRSRRRGRTKGQDAHQNERHDQETLLPHGFPPWDAVHPLCSPQRELSLRWVICVSDE